MARRRVAVAVLLGLVAAVSGAQPIITGVQITTVGALNPTPSTGFLYVVTDGASALDCTTGGGAIVVICWGNAAGDGYIAQASNADTAAASFTNLDTDYGNETITVDFDFGGGTLQIPNSITLPGTCEVGDEYMDTNATSGQRFYLCESSNVWVQQGGATFTPNADPGVDHSSYVAGHGDGANCTTGNYPLGVDAAGAVQTCTPDDTGTDDQTAAEVAFTPDTGAEWSDPDPTEVDAALENLAPRVLANDAKVTFAPNADPGVDHSSYVAGHSNGANCTTAGEWPAGVDGSGVVEGCASVLPANATPTTDGQIAYDSTGETLTVGDDGVATHVISPDAVTDAHFDHADNLTELNTQISSGLVTGAHTTVDADHIDALTEIAQGIKTAANDTDPLAVYTGGNPGSNVCVEMTSTGTLIAAADTCANLGPGGTPTLIETLDTNVTTADTGTDGNVTIDADGALVATMSSDGTTPATVFRSPGSGTNSLHVFEIDLEDLVSPRFIVREDGDVLFPGSGSDNTVNERHVLIGLSSNANATSSTLGDAQTAIGRAVGCGTAGGCTAVGAQNTGSGGAHNYLFGTNNDASGGTADSNLIFGRGIDTDDDNGLLIGQGHVVSVGDQWNAFIAPQGGGCTSWGADRVFAFGCPGNSRMLDAYWGEAYTDATPSDFTHHATGGSGTDIAGATLNLAGGQGTGAGEGGDVVFQGSQAGGTGTTLRSLTELWRMDAETGDLTTTVGGITLADEGFIDALGLEFEAGDALTDCSTFSATGGGIFFDDSEGIFKKCEDNVLTDLDTGGGGGEANTISSQGGATALTAATPKSGVDLRIVSANATRFSVATDVLDIASVAGITGANEDDLSDDLITALSGVTTVTDGSYCQGGAGSSMDCDITQANIPGADHIDTITEIAASLKSGADLTLTTGTAGTSGNCAEWNVDGDLVDSGGTCGGSGSPGGSTTEWQYRAGASTFGAIPGSSVDATNELITFAPTIDQATGDEVGFSLSPTFNKATSGDATALGITITDTASPGVLYLSEMEVTGGAKLDIRPEDGWGLTWTQTSAGGALNGPALFPEAASAANPNIVANRNDPDTGLGRAGVDIFTAVAGGTEGFSLWEGGWGSSAGDMVLELFDVTTAPTSNPAADDLLLYVDGDSLWIRKDDGTTVDLGASGAGMTSFNIDGDNNSPQTITDGNEALFVGGTNITTTAAVTDQVTIDLDLTGITDSQVLYDNSDALGGISQLTYDGTNLTLAPTSGDSVIAEEIIGEYYNNSGATIFKCAAVYISGFNVGADLPEISVADNDGAGTMPAVGILYADITNASAGFVVEFGNPVDLDTTVTEVWSAGDAVYVNASGTSTSADCSDTLTSTKPTGASNLIQKIGTVSRVNATNGSIEVSGAGRTNDVPNAIIIGTDDTINTDSVTLDNTWASAQLVATVVHDTESPTGGDVSGDFATGLVVADDSHNHVITNIDSFTKTQLETQTSDTDTFYTEDTVVPVADGGTGASSLTDGGILLGSGTGAVTALGVATNGQIPIGDGATDPVLATITGTANEITVTNGAGSITLDIPTSPTLDGTNFTGIPSSAITNEVRSMYWGAGAMSTDGTECTDPSELTINSGPKQFTVSCPHTTSETDGFVYGSTVLMDGFDQTADVTFELSAYIVTDSGAGTWHGEIAIQCQSAGEIIDSTWGTGIGLDLTPVGGDVAFDVIQDVSGAVDTDTTGEDCDAGDVLFWRWKSCDTDATPSSGCTSSAGFENDMNLIGMKMEYTTNVGD